MKVTGLLGGMTSESSAEYYKLINKLAREKMGGNHSAKSVMVSVDFGEVEPLMEQGKWDMVLDILSRASENVEKGGADFLVICTNTIHKFAEKIGDRINIPVLNIIDVTAEEIRNKGFKKVGLLGTRFTMEEDFYKARLEKKHGIEAIIPSPDERKTIHSVIMKELSVGIINPDSREEYLKIIKNLAADGAQGVILGCTEIPLLVSDKDTDIPLFDTTLLHAKAAVNFAL
ncbi:MAG: aspartate/glutamate racemase family protein [Acidobacteriota bacterium]